MASGILRTSALEKPNGASGRQLRGERLDLCHKGLWLVAFQRIPQSCKPILPG